MENDPKEFLDLRLIAMDIAGWLLIGLGIAKLAGGIDVVPAPWRFEHYEIAMIVVGALLAAPYTLQIEKITARRGGQGPGLP